MPQKSVSVSDAEIYARSLLSRCHGYPLWIPEPYGVIAEHQSVGIRIGDVGYVTEDGAFETLFNVRAEADDPINQHGVPQGFQPKHLDEKDITTVVNMHRPGAIPCISGTQGSLNLGVSADNMLSPVGVGGGLEVTWHSSEGAVAHLPSGAARVRASPDHFRDYIFENAEGWYQFANETLHRGVPPGRLYFITGFDKTHSWMVGAFSRDSSSRAVSLKVGAFGIGQAEASFSYSWNNTRVPTYRTGPHTPDLPISPSNVASHGASRELESSISAIDHNAPGGRNQCIFVRGFSIALRKMPFSRQTEAKISLIQEMKPWDVVRFSKQYSSWAQLFQRLITGGPKESISRNRQIATPGAGSSSLNVLPSSTSDREFSETQVEIEFVPSVPESFHPSTILNEVLLQAVPDARIVITHDEDWCTMADPRAVVTHDEDWWCNVNLGDPIAVLRKNYDLGRYISSRHGTAYFINLDSLLEEGNRSSGPTDPANINPNSMTVDHISGKNEESYHTRATGADPGSSSVGNSVHHDSALRTAAQASEENKTAQQSPRTTATSSYSRSRPSTGSSTQNKVPLHASPSARQRLNAWASRNRCRVEYTQSPPSERPGMVTWEVRVTLMPRLTQDPYFLGYGSKIDLAKEMAATSAIEALLSLGYTL